MPLGTRAFGPDGIPVLPLGFGCGAVGGLRVGGSAADRRWCIRWMEGEMTPAPARYATPRWQRTDFGRPVSSIRFRTVTPMAASACWAAKPRARSLGPIRAL